MTRVLDISAEPQRITLADQVLAHAAFPLHAIYYPFGFPVEIITNSADVLEAAAQSWGMFRSRFEHKPLTLRLGVAKDPDDSESLSPEPVCRVQQHLLSCIADPYNFVHCDLNTGFSFGWVTQRTVESIPYLRYHIIETAVLGMIATSRAVPLHAACVSLNGHGMLLCGDTGAGKSSLAFAGVRSGWTFTCDDASYIPLGRKDHLVLGNCHQFRLRDSGAQLFPELEGRSITPRATGKPSIEIPTAELPGIAISERASVQSIIFLNRNNVDRAELIPSSLETARSWFRQSPYTGTLQFADQLATIDHLLTVPIYELRYTDLDWAIERLNLLAEQGH